MIRIYTFEKNFLVLFYVWGSPTSRLQSHCKEIVYFLLLTFWPLVLNARPLKWESSALIAAHLPPGFESAFFKKGYLLILISGGVTRDVQVKHIYHKDSKTAYTEREKWNWCWIFSLKIRPRRDLMVRICIREKFTTKLIVYIHKRKLWRLLPMMGPRII